MLRWSSDTCLCGSCYSDLCAGGGKATELLEAIADFAGEGKGKGKGARVADLGEGTFEEVVWDAEAEREYDDYVQCTRCEGWYHLVCSMFPAPEQVRQASISFHRHPSPSPRLF